VTGALKPPSRPNLGRHPLFVRLARYREAIEYARYAFRVGNKGERSKALNKLDDSVQDSPREEPHEPT
jgi:hypothetical protein